VRRKSVRAGRAASPTDDDFEERSRAGLFLLQALQWGRRDAVGFIVAAFATGAILINALFLQAGPHPAPLFKSAALIAPTGDAKNTPVAALPRARPSDHTAGTEQPAPVRPNGEIITDIQRELTRRGFYDGSVDGLYGPKTDAAIRDFEQAAGLRPSAEPNEALVRAILRSNATKKGGTLPAPHARATPVRAEASAERPATSKRVMAVQRALTEYGYGQIRPTGLLDTETQAAIEKFERDRKLPVTRQVSDRLARELAAMTGRPLE